MFDELTRTTAETTEAFINLGQKILEGLRPLAEAVINTASLIYGTYATPKERWLMLHARRRRVRKKYRDRIIRRMIADVNFDDGESA